MCTLLLVVGMGGGVVRGATVWCGEFNYTDPVRGPLAARAPLNITISGDGAVATSGA